MRTASGRHRSARGATAAFGQGFVGQAHGFCAAPAEARALTFGIGAPEIINRVYEGETGTPLTEIELTDEQLKATRSFQLLTLKRRLALINVADDETDLERYSRFSTPRRPVIAVPVGLELELTRMESAERDQFRAEMGLVSFDRDALVRRIMEASGQMLFFTAGEKEVRTWMIPQGATAVEAADSIHSDLARGFIRAETMSCDDLIRLGSEREIKAKGLMRQEPKDYRIQDGDILNIRFSV